MVEIFLKRSRLISKSESNRKAHICTVNTSWDWDPPWIHTACPWYGMMVGPFGTLKYCIGIDVGEVGCEEQDQFPLQLCRCEEWVAGDAWPDLVPVWPRLWTCPSGGWVHQEQDHLALGFLWLVVQKASSIWCVLLVAPALISLIFHLSVGRRTTEILQDRFLPTKGFSVRHWRIWALCG